jgi:ABC-type glycerol-3-phosphate transport system substrate-binding protein
MTTALAGNTLPDVMASYDQLVNFFANSGITMNLDELMSQQPGLTRESFNQQFLQVGVAYGGEAEGELHMLPMGADVVVLFYNRRLFDEAGVDYPTSDWDWNEFVETAEALTTRGDDGSTQVYGFVGNYAWWAIYTPMIKNFGGSLTNGAVTEATFASPEALRAWETLLGPVREGVFAPPSVINTVGSDFATFGAGQAAMFAGVRAHVPLIRANLEDDWDVVEFPRTNGRKGSGAGAVGVSISATTDHPDAAWDFVQYIYSAEGGMSILASNYAVVPPLEDLYDSPVWRDLEGPPYNNDVFVDAMDHATIIPPLPFATAGGFFDAVSEAVDRYLLDENVSIGEVMSEAEVRATRALQEE